MASFASTILDRVLAGRGDGLETGGDLFLTPGDSYFLRDFEGRTLDVPGEDPVDALRRIDHQRTGRVAAFADELESVAGPPEGRANLQWRRCRPLGIARMVRGYAACFACARTTAGDPARRPQRDRCVRLRHGRRACFEIGAIDEAGINRPRPERPRAFTETGAGNAAIIAARPGDDRWQPGPPRAGRALRYESEPRSDDLLAIIAESIETG